MPQGSNSDSKLILFHSKDKYSAYPNDIKTLKKKLFEGEAETFKHKIEKQMLKAQKKKIQNIEVN
jgi:hypothetical protein